MKKTEYSEADLVAAKMWAKFLNLTTVNPKSVNHVLSLLYDCEGTGEFIENILVKGAAEN